MEHCAWQGGRPSAAPICCMLNIYEGPSARLRSAAQEFAGLVGCRAAQLVHGYSGSEFQCFFPRLYLAREQILGGLQRGPVEPSTRLPPRIFSAIMFRAVCALAQRGTFGAAS